MSVSVFFGEWGFPVFFDKVIRRLRSVEIRISCDVYPDAEIKIVVPGTADSSKLPSALVVTVWENTPPLAETEAP